MRFVVVLDNFTRKIEIFVWEKNVSQRFSFKTKFKIQVFLWLNSCQKVLGMESGSRLAILSNMILISKRVPRGVNESLQSVHQRLTGMTLHDIKL